MSFSGINLANINTSISSNVFNSLVSSRNNTNRPEAFKGEVNIIGIEGIAKRELASRESKVTESQNTLTKTSQFHVCIVELFFPFIIQRNFFAIDQDCGTSFQNSLRSTLHYKQVATATFCFMN